MGRFLTKRGQVPEDAMFFIVILMAIAIGGLIATYSINQFVELAGNTTLINSTETRSAFQAAQGINDMWDYLILVILIGFAIGVMILGYFIDAHSVFMPLYIIFMLVGVVVAGVLQFVWTQVSDTVLLSSLTTTNFPITNHIMSNLAIYFTVIGALSLIATYSKTREGE